MPKSCGNADPAPTTEPLEGTGPCLGWKQRERVGFQWFSALTTWRILRSVVLELCGFERRIWQPGKVVDIVRFFWPGASFSTVAFHRIRRRTEDPNPKAQSLLATLFLESTVLHPETTNLDL